MAVNQQAPSSPSPVIDRVIKESWKGHTPTGTQSPQEALNDKHTKKTVSVPTPKK